MFGSLDGGGRVWLSEPVPNAFVWDIEHGAERTLEIARDLVPDASDHVGFDYVHFGKPFSEPRWHCWVVPYDVYKERERVRTTSP